MVYFGYQQSKGGYAYYHSGKRGSVFVDKEIDTDSAQVPVDVDNIPETAQDDKKPDVMTQSKPDTEKVKMESEVLEEGVQATDGADKVGKIELEQS